MSFIHTLDAYITDQMEQKLVPGLSLAIVEDGRIVVEKSYGSADARTVYELGSLRQSFIAVAILMFVQEGHLNLDDPITRYRVGLPEAWQAITLRHLLTHTSGLADGLPNAESLVSPAGVRAAYAEINYTLLAQIIHILIDAPVDVFFHDQFFAPLEMTATGSNGATGSLHSTLSDLIKWEAALMGGQILSQSALQEMFTPFTLANGEPAPFGLGCEIATFQGHKLVATNGRGLGFSASITRFVNDSLTLGSG